MLRKMANIWLDEQINHTAASGEVNHGHKSAIKSKVLLSARNPTVKRQAFGNINNVIHNQLGITPFRGNSKVQSNNIPTKFEPSKSLCNDVLRKQQFKQNFSDAQTKLEKLLKSPEVVHKNKVNVCEKDDLFDSWDFYRCCKNNKQRTDAEIWSDINGNELYEKLTKSVPIFSYDEQHENFTYPIDVMNETELNYMMNDMILPDEQLALEYDEMEFNLSLPEVEQDFDVGF